MNPTIKIQFYNHNVFKYKFLPAYPLLISYRVSEVTGEIWQHQDRGLFCLQMIFPSYLWSLCLLFITVEIMKAYHTRHWRKIHDFSNLQASSPTLEHFIAEVPPQSRPFPSFLHSRLLLSPTNDLTTSASQYVRRCSKYLNPKLYRTWQVITVLILWMWPSSKLAVSAGSVEYNPGRLNHSTALPTVLAEYYWTAIF